MPELPDIALYLHALEPRVLNQPLEGTRVVNPFVLRSVDPPLTDAVGKRVTDLRRLGKRIVFALEDNHFIVMHLMIAGRLRWLKANAKLPGRITLAAFDFPNGTLALTEAGSQKRAALHLVRGESELAAQDPGGLEILDADLPAFRDALARRNHTLKRALTDPRVFSGIGNAYSDEILHASRLSPLALTQKLTDDQIASLYEAARDTLTDWMERLIREFADRFPGPGDVTAFRPDFAVHGRFGQPCSDCGTPVQRIRYAQTETNYCPACQTNGRILADRSLSRLLKDDWPRSIEDLQTP